MGGVPPCCFKHNPPAPRAAAVAALPRPAIIQGKENNSLYTSVLNCKLCWGQPYQPNLSISFYSFLIFSISMHSTKDCTAPSLSNSLGSRRSAKAPKSLRTLTVAIWLHSLCQGTKFAKELYKNWVAGSSRALQPVTTLLTFVGKHSQGMLLGDQRNHRYPWLRHRHGGIGCHVPWRSLSSV